MIGSGDNTYYLGLKLFVWKSFADLVKEQFQKVDKKYIQSRGQDYDYDSIMHYSRYQGSIDPGKLPVLVPKKPNIELGQRHEPSPGDIRQINLMYRCNGKYEKKWFTSFICLSIVNGGYYS